MSYVIQAVLSNAQHPEYGQVTIPFPIPNQNYDCTIELLEPLEIGDTLRQDCQVDELDSFYTVLNALIGTQVTLDELDYLAKRLDSFDDGEAAQFQGMAHKLGLSKIKDLINLTFCCQKATVITDFSDLEKIGREHYMNLNGGCARTEDLEALDGTETAYLLIDSGAGTVTPYGVAYDNSMKLEPLYNGRQFPEYLYDNSSMGLKIVPAENQAPELLWLPASEQQIRRTLLRAGWQDPDHADYTIDVFLLQKEAGRILNEKRDSLHSLNAMCGAIAKLEQKDRDIQLPKAAPVSTDALRIENELALCFNRADINPEYMKTLIMAAAAERYAGLNDPTPTHKLELLRQKLELEPESEETLWEVFESAVAQVRIGKGGEISLHQKDQKECAL